MTRAFQVIGSIVLALLLGAAAFVLWASSGRLPEAELAQTKTYAAAPDTTLPDTLTVASYNVGYLSGMTNNEPVVRSESLFTANMDQAVALLRAASPDVVGLQEVDFGAARSFYAQQLDTLATRLNYPTAAQAVNWDERYVPFPYGRPAVHFGRLLSGQALLSRFPIRQHVRRTLARPPQIFVRDIFYLDRLAQVAVLDVGGHALGVINVHLEAFDTATRERQARTVNSIYDRLTREGLPVFLLGDFNSVLPVAKGDLPPEDRRRFADDATMPTLLEGTNLASAAVQTDTSQAALPTYPADAPTRRIDYVFYPPDVFTPTTVRRQCGAPHPPSDHCAVTASFLVPDTATDWPTPDSLPPLDTLLTE